MMEQLHYECVGQGEDLLLIHGWGSSLRMWDVLVERLCGRFRCWSVDLVGHGESPTAHYSVDDHTESLVRFCQEHSVWPRAVIAHSMGGLLTLKLALSCPERVPRMVLMAPVVTGRYAFGVSAIIATRPGRYLLDRSKIAWRWAQSDWLAPLLPTIQFRNRAAQARQKRDYQRTELDSAFVLMHSAARENLTPVLPQIVAPALVLIGGRDLTVPPSEGRTAAALLPQARLMEYPQVFHQLLDEEPDEMVRQIESFLGT